ncbi:MAG: hypothetical protein ACOYT4_00330 [Nanoarchaeota archaeon]
MSWRFKAKPRVYRFDDAIKKALKWDLEHSGYYFVESKNIQGNHESYYFKPFFHETARHGILVFEVAEYLRTYTKNVKEYLTRKPDIVFVINKEEWAVEIETGIVLKKNKNQFLEKVEALKEDYGRRWFFVITDRNLLKSYKRYGKTFTKRNVIGKIDRIMHERGVAKIDENWQ